MILLNFKHGVKKETNRPWWSATMQGKDLAADKGVGPDIQNQFIEESAYNALKKEMIGKQIEWDFSLNEYGRPVITGVKSVK